MASLVLAAFVVVLATLGPGPAAAADDDPVPAAGPINPGTLDLDTARRELTTTQRDLSELETVLQRTSDAVAALDERLAQAGDVLAALQADLAEAEQRATRSEAAERRATEALVTADAQLTALLEAWQLSSGELAAQAVEVYKHGRAGDTDRLVRGVLGARDWHEVGLTLRTVERQIAAQRGRVDDTAALARATAAARRQHAAAHRAAVDAARAAAERRSELAALTEQQDRLVGDIGRDLADRQAALDRLEQDRTARAALVVALEDRIDTLERSALRVLVPIEVDLDPFGPPPPWADRLPPAGRSWAAAIEATARRHGVDPQLFAALIWTESAFRPGAVSHAGALGLAQLMPTTARGLGVDPRDPLQNLDGGARYLRTQLDRFGRVDLALAAYNAGPNRVAAAGSQVPDIVETQLHVVRVLDRYERLRG